MARDRNYKSYRLTERGELLLLAVQSLGAGLVAWALFTGLWFALGGK